MASDRVRKMLELAEQLEPAERAELADELWSTLPQAFGAEDEGEHAEIAQRIDDVHARRVDGVSWEEAHAKIRASSPRR